MIIALIFLGVLLFVCGVTFLFKGYVSIPASDSIVPLRDFEKIKKDLESAKGEGNNLTRQLDTITVEYEQTRVKLQESQKAKDVIKELQVIDSENKSKINELDGRLSSFMAKAEQQAKEAVVVINTLTAENEGLRKQAEQVAASVATTIDPQITETLQAEKEALAKAIEEKTMKILQLEGDLAASKVLHDEISAAKGHLEKLTEENQKLKNDIAAAPAEALVNDEELVAAKQTVEQLQKELAAAQAKEVRIQELEKELQLKQDETQKTNQAIEDLKIQLHSRLAAPPLSVDSARPALEREVLRLEEDLVRLRQEKVREEVASLKDHLEAVRKTMDDLKAENKTLLERQKNLEAGATATAAPAPREMITPKAILADIQRSESKPSGHEPWMQEKKQLEQHLRQLKDFNTHLLEKEKMIQMELTKSRIQAKGLEKICEEFKRQLERTTIRK